MYLSSVALSIPVLPTREGIYSLTGIALSRIQDHCHCFAVRSILHSRTLTNGAGSLSRRIYSCDPGPYHHALRDFGKRDPHLHRGKFLPSH